MPTLHTTKILGDLRVTGQTTSTVATGTAPFVIASTTAVSNLNADLLDGQHGSYYRDWANITNKPDPKITLTGAVTGSATMTDLGSISIATTHTADPKITLAGDLTGSVTLTNLGSATLTATIAANSVALGTDTTGNYVVGLTGGTGISIAGTAGEGWTPTINHTNSVTAGTISGSNGSIGFGGSISIPSVTYDAQGHITSTTTTSVKLPQTPSIPSISVTDNGTGAFVTDVTSSGHTITLSRGNFTETTLSKVDDTTGDYMTDITVSGHTITEVKEPFATLTISTGLSGTSYKPNEAKTISLTEVTPGTTQATQGALWYHGITPEAGKFDGSTTNPSGTTRLNYGGYLYASRLYDNGARVLTAHPAISAASSVNNSGRTYIQDITLDSFGHVTGLETATETVVNTNTTYSQSWVDSGNNAILRLSAGGSGSGNDDLILVAGSNITLTPSGDNLTIASTYTNTLNTAGSTDTDSTIYLVGATSQTSSAQTYSDNEVYVTNGTLTTKEVQVGSGNSTWTIDDTTTTNVLTFKNGANTRLRIKEDGLYVNNSETPLGEGSVTSVSLASGANNGTLKLTVNGTTTDNIAVKGLGDAAYTSASNYEPAIATKNTAFNKNYGTTAAHVKMNGTQAVGSIDAVARIDHVHPVDTSRAADSEVVKLSGAQTISGVKTFNNGIIIPGSTNYIDLGNKNNYFWTRFSGENWTFNNNFQGGGWARNLMQVKNSEGDTYFQIGAQGSGQSFSNMYIGPAYNNYWLSLNDTRALFKTKPQYAGNPTVDNDLTRKLYVDNGLNTKVDKVSGKGLSTNDYTNAEKTKLAGIEEGAEKNSNITKAEIEAKLTGSITSHTHNYRPAGNVPWSEVDGKPSFATVATSGSYNDLVDKPIIPTAPGDIDAEPANENIQEHISSEENPHSVTADQLNLGISDNVTFADLTLGSGDQTWEIYNDTTDQKLTFKLDNAIIKLDGSNSTTKTIAFTDSLETNYPEIIDLTGGL